MLTSSGSRVRRDGTIATSSNPYARRAVLPMPISNSMRGCLPGQLLDGVENAERPPRSGWASGSCMHLTIPPAIPATGGSPNADLIQERERVDRIEDAAELRWSDVEAVRHRPRVPLEMIVRRPCVAGLSDVADHRPGTDAPDVREPAEVRVARESARADHGHGLAGEPRVGVRGYQAGERSPDRTADRSVDVVALMRMVAAGRPSLAEVIPIRDPLADRADTKRVAGRRIDGPRAGVGVEPARSLDVPPRHLGTAIDQPDPAHAGDQLLVAPCVLRLVRAGIPSPYEARRAQDQLVAIVAEPRAGDRRHLLHGHGEDAVPGVVRRARGEPSVERRVLPTDDLREEGRVDPCRWQVARQTDRRAHLSAEVSRGIRMQTVARCVDRGGGPRRRC